MPLKVHGTHNIQPGTIESSVLAAGITSNKPKITSIVVTDSSYVNLDDVAVSTSGGYIKITGTGFSAGCQVVVGNQVATSVTFVSSTEVRAQVPAQSAGTYTVYLTNSDGAVAIRVNGLNYSATPAWTTTSPLGNQQPNTSISLQLVATSNSSVTYSLQSGSTLPSGLTLSSSGLLSGTAPNTPSTTYNFTVIATDQENQDTPQAFQITITVAQDPYYNLVTLHIPGNYSGNTGPTSYPLSTSINILGHTGTFSPYSQTGWGNLFNGTSSSFGVSASAVDFQSGDFTIEAWIYLTSLSTVAPIVNGFTTSIGLQVTTSRELEFFQWNGTAYSINIKSSVNTVNLNTWVHVVGVRSGSNASVFVNGARLATTTTVSGTQVGASETLIGKNGAGTRWLAGYISNLRIVKGTAVYNPTQTTLTVPTSKLTAITNTSLLTCQSYRFKDSSSNNYSISPSSSVKVVSFSPFSPAGSWTFPSNTYSGVPPAPYGGSMYTNGSGQYAYASIGFNSSTDFCIEGWVYFVSRNATASRLIEFYNGGYLGTQGTSVIWQAPNGGNTIQIIGGTVQDNAWNHICIIKGSTLVYLYLNGEQVNSTNSGAGAFSSDVVYIGSSANGTSNQSAAYYSQILISNGTLNSYPAGSGSNSSWDTLTNPTGLFPQNNTVLNTHFTHQSIFDATSKNNLFVNTPGPDTTTKKWGNASINFRGAGTSDSISTFNVDNILGFGTDDWTIEFWLNLKTNTGTKGIFDGRTIFSDIAPFIYYSSGLKYYTASSDRITGGTLTAGVWYYIAVVRSSGNTRMYIDGVQTGATYADSNNYVNQSQRPLLGTNTANVSNERLDGYMQDIRVTKGYARTITVPTAAFPTR